MGSIFGNEDRFETKSSTEIINSKVGKKISIYATTNGSIGTSYRMLNTNYKKYLEPVDSS